jgi:DNA-binding transcriptional ArsR family regulator
MARALGHPLRTAILVELNQRTASPVGLARDLDEPIGNVSYHVRVLLDLDCIELVETRPRRGALEHFYRATARPELTDQEWATLPRATRHAMATQWFRHAFTDVSQALDAGQLAAADVHQTLTHVELTEEGWAETNRRLLEVLDRTLALHAEAASTSASKRHGTLLMAFFEPPRKKPADETSSG